MANIINHNFHDLKLLLKSDEYWDFFINHDRMPSLNDLKDNTKIYDKCLISYIDISNKDCVYQNWIYSLDEYKWQYAFLDDTYAMKNISFTGFDNGLLYFEKDKITNKDFVELYTNPNSFSVSNTNLKLHQVTGVTQQFEYPVTVEEDKLKLNGGFYQGFFKTECDKYQVLPSVLNNGDVWHFEFTLNKQDFEKESNKTLNDKYPENKGIFFYIGTRAENKWVYLYDYLEEVKKASPCILSGMTDNDLYYQENNFDNTILEDLFNMQPNELIRKKRFSIEDLFEVEEDENDNLKQIDCSYEKETYQVENELDISDFNYNTSDEINVSLNEKAIKTNNKYLLFNRTCTGYSVNNWDENIEMNIIDNTKDYDENLFLLMNRTCTGYNVNNIEASGHEIKHKYNIYKDLYNNALAFIIKDDGSIGYRYLVLDCETENQINMIEAYSYPNIIQENLWYTINIQICAYEKTMKLYFYVNGELKFISNEIPKLDLRNLYEHISKQEGVPYNISLGGGTQGLCETVMPNYYFIPNHVFPLEQYFAGSFIGYISSFKMYDCFMEHIHIKHNYIWNKTKYK